VTAALSIFLLAAIGLAIDGGHLYAQHQAAQAAADSAAQAGIMSIFDGTNTSGTHAFPVAVGTTYTCTSNSAMTPCYYAQTLNGFNQTGDIVTYTPNPSGVNFPNLSSLDTINLLQVTVRRNVPMTLTKLVGWSNITIQASGIAAIVQVMSPVPIIVTHPTLSGSFNLGGSGSTNKIQICGGPSKSIQVNSNSATAVTWTGNPTVDLSKAGPRDPGNCTTGTGADFGTWGGPAGASTIVSVGSTGRFVNHASPIADPLAAVGAPPDPTTINSSDLNPSTGTLAAGSQGCPAGSGGCTLYFPGKYTAGHDIKAKNASLVFAPGIYYMYGTNFQAQANGNMYYATGLTDSSASGTPTIANCCGTGTGWGLATNIPANSGILVYMTGSGTPASTGTISISSNSNVSLVGSPNSSNYKGILFFVDRNAAAATHSLDGGGGLTLMGTIYTTSAYNTASIYQTLHFQGNAGSQTLITGEIITSTLDLRGTPGIVMNLNALPSYRVRQVALIQ
jgi:Flp pilus assembly protein TadG